MARLGASLKAKPKGRKAQAKKTLKKITQLGIPLIRALICCQLRHSALSSGSSLTIVFSQQTLAQKILEQTCQKLHVVRSIPDRFVSFYDPECRASSREN